MEFGTHFTARKHIGWANISNFFLSFAFLGKFIYKKQQLNIARRIEFMEVAYVESFILQPAR